MSIKNDLKLKQVWKTLAYNHPKVPPFIKNIKEKGIKERMEIAVAVRYPDGTEYKAGIRMTQEDVNAVRYYLIDIDSSSVDNSRMHNVINIECPQTIVNNGYIIKVKDIYVRNENSNLWLYLTCELAGEKHEHYDSDDWFALYFDMYDSDNHYVGKVQAVYATNLFDVPYGTIINDDAVLSANDVKRVVYTTHG